jgi:hypothetical protein
VIKIDGVVEIGEVYSVGYNALVERVKRIILKWILDKCLND